MALYTLGDTHLSLGGNKAMDSFGGAWEGYVNKLRSAFADLTEEDGVVLCGDLSWGMSLEEALPDFLFLDSLFPGKKFLVKGNHDYWWTTANKMYQFWAQNGIQNFELLHNNCCLWGDVALCGTRGWFFEEEADGHNEKVFHREVLRLETSLKAAGRGRRCVSSTTPPCTRVISARRSWICWSVTGSQPATTVTSMAAAIAWPGRAARGAWSTTLWPEIIWIFSL